MHIENCCKGLDDKTLKEIKEKMPKEEALYLLSDFFKVFGDSTRIKLIYALFNGEMCVGTIANLLDMSQSSVSHQLRILRNNRLVKTRKEGKLVYYSLDDKHVEAIYQMGLDHIMEKEVK
ncbi:ArsR/SmtB family transcription factor [Tepidibacter formicigenes]|uniref:Transcriptional regulator, ArsR family n=1 Tax=Tepidibacter formicigenes DSM 15518 TaxID=1123349 RepID=A0A1M6N0H6_9FIRM|nr:metalloregulator ArsR/SmtB family transcription factor [Tepidibacter formicigenes]SHJ89211.1 transcriptional regulator, ArsR family [Tepidibacter formicigenes DSM 15518]